MMGIVLRSGGVCVRVNVRFVWGAFVSCCFPGCFACGCVLKLVVCRVRFARVSCPWLRLERKTQTRTKTASEDRFSTAARTAASPESTVPRTWAGKKTPGGAGKRKQLIPGARP